jgi:acetamidase/formamidase
MVHVIPRRRRSLHGHFSRDLEPILEIAPGDRVRTSVHDSGWRGFEDVRDPELDAGHCLVGPVALRGAEPGDALAVRIVRLRPGPTAWNGGGGFSSRVNDHLGIAEGPMAEVSWEIDGAAGVAHSSLGLDVRLGPFLGVIGLAPAEPGVHSTTPPRRVGGNIDCRELVAGSVLHLPVEVSGALLSFGDGHAAQGDGELSTLALECAMEEIELEIGLEKDAAPDWPWAETAAGHLRFGFAATLDEAMLIAVEGMARHLSAELGIDLRQAVAVASAAVDLRVTQVVNQTVGVHAVLPPEAVRRPGR